MNRDDLFKSFQEVDEELLERSEKTARPHRGSAWLKWGALAACLCLIAAVAAVPLSRPAVAGPEITEPPVTMEKDERGIPGKLTFAPTANTSETYRNLPELLAYLSDHDVHSDKRTEASGGSAVSSESTLTENTGVAVSADEKYAYHIVENAVQISLLDGDNTKNVGSLDVSADGVFVCGNNLWIVSQPRPDGGGLLGEQSTHVGIYDITVPQAPVLRDEYTQAGALTTCWMAGDALYLVTGDGVCACGWSRLDDTAGYYPKLSRNGSDLTWGDEDISILGEPTRVQYSAVTVIDGNSGELLNREALYGDILKLFYGEDWLAVTVAGETESLRENPVIYTFDGDLSFTGKISPAQIMGAPEANVLKDHEPKDGSYLSIDSVTKRGGVYRMVGTVTVQNGETGVSRFLAMAANPETGEAGTAFLSAADYPYGAFTEVRWEENRAILCVKTMDFSSDKDIRQETKFLFAGFEGLDIRFYETDLTADHLDCRVGLSYGNPMDQFRTLVPMGNGIYLRYSHPGQGPGGFDVFDFSDSANPRLLYRPEKSLSGEYAFDYTWYVYDEHTFGTLMILPGEREDAEYVNLAWCVYSVDTEGKTTISLKRESPLAGEIDGFHGADAIGFTVFRAGEGLYCVTRYGEAAVALS